MAEHSLLRLTSGDQQNETLLRKELQIFLWMTLPMRIRCWVIYLSLNHNVNFLNRDQSSVESRFFEFSVFLTFFTEPELTPPALSQTLRF